MRKRDLARVHITVDGIDGRATMLLDRGRLTFGLFCTYEAAVEQHNYYADKGQELNALVGTLVFRAKVDAA